MPTATLGLFGATAACVRLLNLDVEGLATALCIGASLASGLKANFGTPVKPLHIGQAARKSGLDAKFSVQFLTFKALHTGRIRLNDFADEALMPPALKALIERVAVTAHERADEFLAEVKVTLTDGSVREAAASARLGRGPDDPLSAGEFESKFMDCASDLLGGRPRTRLSKASFAWMNCPTSPA